MLSLTDELIIIIKVCPLVIKPLKFTRKTEDYTIFSFVNKAANVKE